jgi:non-specific protein-tyrosine kinase
MRGRVNAYTQKQGDAMLTERCRTFITRFSQNFKLIKSFAWVEKCKTFLSRFRKTEPLHETIYPHQQKYVMTQADKENAGWIAPRYTVSRSVVLDQQLLSDNRCVAIFCDSAITEQYKVLRTQILSCTQEKGGTTIMITSANPREGKTLTAANLALTFAKQFEQTVLLVDCDLRQQGVHRLFGFESTMGLIDYLADNRPVSDIMIWPGIDKLTLISGGRLTNESTELLGSLRMRNLVDDMKTRYPDRFILFDVPPVLGGADSIVFAPFVDFIIVVVASGKTAASDVKKAIDLLPREKVIGFVLNRHGALSKGKGGRVEA